MNASNIVDPKVVSAALHRVFDKLGNHPKRVALAIPDSVAKVSLLRFEKVPERPHDLEELVRWQVRKAAPFRVDDAQLSFVPGQKGADGSTEFVVVMARKDLVREYEAVCEGAGAHAGVVDLTTFNVINAVLAGSQAPADDWLLVHVAQEDATMAILRGSHLVFFRNRAADGEASLADMVHQTAMYYEDRLSGSGFARVVLAESGSPATPGRGESRLPRQSSGARAAPRENVDSVDDTTGSHSWDCSRGNGRPETMLRTNLSTRPFYNERGVHVLLAVTVLIVFALSLFNIVQIGLLTTRQLTLGGQTEANEARARELRAHAAQTRQSINPQQLEAVSTAAREANSIIGQRLFSWTDLLNRLETTLPDDVRITNLRPTVDRDGLVTVQMTVTSRRVDDVDQFIKNLEATGSFSQVYSPEDDTTEDGLVQAMVRGQYVASH